jgi:outer membrane protein assembly factor BamA
VKFFRILFILILLLLIVPNAILATDDKPVTESNDSKTHFFGFPILSESPETGFAIGGYFLAYRNLNPESVQDKIDTLNGILMYTEEEQLLLSLGINKHLQGDRFLLSTNCSYIDFPSKFYGIGPNTDEDWEEDYTLVSKSFHGSFLLRLTPHIYFGPSVTYSEFNIEDREPGGLLATGYINGCDGATVAGAGVKLTRDTRDNGFLPQNGSLLNAQVISYRKSLGSDGNFSQLNSSYRCFWPVRDTETLAFMSALTLSDDDTPFEMMPALGGPVIMRGYYGGRYRDRNFIALQGEYRFPIINRLSGVAFASLGEVAPEIEQFNFDNIKAAGGFGLRFRIDPNQKINLRFDIGASEEGICVYINFMEAF